MRALAAAAALLLATPAMADTYMMTGNQLFGLEQGLLKLSGYDKIVQEGNQQRVVTVGYDLTSGMRLLIADDINTIESRLNVIRNAVKAETVNVSDKDKMALITAKMFDSPVKIDLSPIDIQQLNLDANPIPASVLAVIMPVSVKTKK